jgi:hypothetical protein
MIVENHPKAAFGRRGRDIHRPEPQNQRKARPARLNVRVLLGIGMLGLLLVVFGAIVSALPGMENLDADATKAEQRVVEIVNQPVTRLPRTAAAAVFPAGWFDPGAIKPDFNTVDVRKTQEFIYDRYAYVTSDLNPSEMFVGGELEFNSMTKYFYTDRTLPKKQLSEPEMLEINRLYRRIGSDQQMRAARLKMVAGLLTLALSLGAAMLFLILRT